MLLFFNFWIGTISKISLIFHDFGGNMTPLCPICVWPCAVHGYDRKEKNNYLWLSDYHSQSSRISNCSSSISPKSSYSKCIVLLHKNPVCFATLYWEWVFVRVIGCKFGPSLRPFNTWNWDNKTTKNKSRITFYRECRIMGVKTRPEPTPVNIIVLDVFRIVQFYLLLVFAPSHRIRTRLYREEQGRVTGLKGSYVKP